MRSLGLVMGFLIGLCGPFSQMSFCGDSSHSLRVEAALAQAKPHKREVGGGIGMGNTCKSMTNSCQCMTKTTTIL